MTTAQAPSLGRIVHYKSQGSMTGAFEAETYSAIISRLPEAGGEIVGLTVFQPIGVFYKGAVPYAETPTPGHWSWPPRV